MSFASINLLNQMFTVDALLTLFIWLVGIEVEVFIKKKKKKKNEEK